MLTKQRIGRLVCASLVLAISGAAFAAEPSIETLTANLSSSDRDVRDQARLSLQRLNTPEAKKVLRSALAAAEPDFQCSLLGSLGELKDAESLDAIKRLLTGGDDKVRVAAARALAWTGDPANLPAVQKVVADSDGGTKKDAVDAELRLLDAMAAKGGSWQLACDTYKSLLNSTELEQKEAVLAGLGRIGDGSCVKPVLAVIKDAAQPLQAAGLAALRDMKGPDVAKALVDAYPTQPEKLQTSLLPVLGAKKHPLVMPILLEAAKSGESATRIAAFKALAECEQPEALDALTTAAKTGSDEEKAVGRAGLVRLADGLRAQNKLEEAGKVYLAVLNLAGDDAMRTQALTGLAACPTGDAFDPLMALAGNAALREPVAAALVVMGTKLRSAGNKDKARAAYEKVLQMGTSLDVLRKAARGAADCGAKIDLGPLLGMITHWWVIGPFELGEGRRGWNLDYIHEASARPTGAYKSGYKELTWKHVASKDPSGAIDLRAELADRDACIGYAYAEVTVKADTDAVLLLGVDDSEKVWLNGQKVFEQFVSRGLTPDQDRIPLKLRAGRNTILLKIWQNMAGWGFCARLTGADGRPLPFTQKTE